MGFQIPEDISALDYQALSEAIEAARAEAAEFGEDLTDEQADRLVELGEFVAAASGVQAERDAAASARNEKIAAAREALSVQPEEEADPETEQVEEEEKVEEREAVVAAAPKRSALSRAAKVTKAPEPVATPRASITAAADVPGFALGQEFTDLGAAGKAVMSRLKSMPTRMAGGNTFSRQGALVIRKHNPSGFSDETLRGEELLMAAANEARLPGGSLVAAGGWGAPSETLLDFCSFEQAVGLLDLPSVNITRGGIQYTKGPSFADVLGSATGFIDQTEAQAEAGVEKTVLRPDIPGFTEVRLEAVGVIVEAGLLLRSAWPELVQRYVEMALVAHEYKVSAKLLAKIQGYTGPAIALANGFGNALDILHGLEVVALGERQRFAMGDNETLEVLLPFWVKALVRADLANRNGVDFLSVSDAQIDGFFSARNLRVQWLRQYQPIDTDTNGIATAYPGTVEAIMYPAGTYVKGEADVLTLDTVYDSVNLKKNDYLALFTEEGVLVTNPCGEGRRISIPLTATGRTGAADITGGLFVAPAV